MLQLNSLETTAMLFFALGGIAVEQAYREWSKNWEPPAGGR